MLAACKHHRSLDWYAQDTHCPRQAYAMVLAMESKESGYIPTEIVGVVWYSWLYGNLGVKDLLRRKKPTIAALRERP